MKPTTQPHSLPTTLSLWREYGALALFFLVATLGASMLVAPMQSLLSLSSGCAICVAYVLQFGSTIFFGIYQRTQKGERGRAFAQFFERTPFDISVVLLGVVMVSATSLVIEPLLNLLPERYMEGLSSLMGRGGWMMITALLCAPLMEEMLFRGVLQKGLVGRVGPLWGVLLSAAIFGAVHGIAQQVINALFVGIVLGVIYLRTSSLWCVILIHAINNAIAYFLWMLSGEALLPTSDYFANTTHYHWLYATACVVVLVGAGWALLFLRRSQRAWRAQKSTKSEQISPLEGNSNPLLHVESYSKPQTTNLC